MLTLAVTEVNRLVCNELPSPFLGPLIPSSAAISEGWRLRHTSSFSLKRISTSGAVTHAGSRQVRATFPRPETYKSSKIRVEIDGDRGVDALSDVFGT